MYVVQGTFSGEAGWGTVCFPSCLVRLERWEASLRKYRGSEMVSCEVERKRGTGISGVPKEKKKVEKKERDTQDECQG